MLSRTKLAFNWLSFLPVYAPVLVNPQRSPGTAHGVFDKVLTSDPLDFDMFSCIFSDVILTNDINIL